MWHLWREAGQRLGIVLMNKRSNERHQVLKTGTISFESSKIDCAVHDLSQGGANLEVDSQIGIPDAFDLLIADPGRHGCHVVWRQERRSCVAFSCELLRCDVRPELIPEEGYPGSDIA
jgi:hypothetical protein